MINIVKKISHFIPSEYTNTCAIIYCSARKEGESINEYVKISRVKSVLYHAGLLK